MDSGGHRLLSRSEEKQKKTLNGNSIFVRSRNFPVRIPSHSCTHGTFSTFPEPYDFERDLRTYYALLPGRYFIVPKKRLGNDDATGISPSPFNNPDTLRIPVIVQDW
jgi:hypothetical protein